MNTQRIRTREGGIGCAMKITFLCTGKTSDKHVTELMQVYMKRIGNYCSFQVIETADVKSTGPVESKKKETLQLKKEIEKADHIVLLDETGKEMSSKKFAEFIEKKQLMRKKHLIFVIGGAHGFSDEIYKMAHEKISLSQMTFPHQLIRVLFLEQLYRAFTILHNEPYHH